MCYRHYCEDMWPSITKRHLGYLTLRTFEPWTPALRQQKIMVFIYFNISTSWFNNCTTSMLLAQWRQLSRSTTWRQHFFVGLFPIVSHMSERTKFKLQLQTAINSQTIVWCGLYSRAFLRNFDWGPEAWPRCGRCAGGGHPLLPGYGVITPVKFLKF